MSDSQDPSPQADAPAPIRLEMSQKSKISCTVILLVGIALIAGSCLVSQSHGRNQANEFVSAVYSSIGKVPVPEYAEVHGMLSSSAEQTLQKAATVNGQIQSWSIIKTDTGITGRPSTVFVDVKRNDKDYVDVVVTTDNQHIAVVVEFPKADWESSRGDRAVRVIAK